MKFSELLTGDVFVIFEYGVKYAKMDQGRALFHPENGRCNGEYREFNNDIEVIPKGTMLKKDWYKSDEKPIESTKYVLINDVSGPNEHRLRIHEQSDRILIHPSNTETLDGWFSPISLHYKDGVPILTVYPDRTTNKPVVISLRDAMSPMKM
jgi:hypothetical protein